MKDTIFGTVFRTLDELWADGLHPTWELEAQQLYRLIEPLPEIERLHLATAVIISLRQMVSPSNPYRDRVLLWVANFCKMIRVQELVLI
jgi:hypothetical protein